MTPVIESPAESAVYREILVRTFPELSDAIFTVHTSGWHCIAVDVDNTWIFKFPRHEAAAQALRREAALLSIVRPAVTLPVPDMELFDDPQLFSRHRKLRGEHLTTPVYDTLPPIVRQRLAATLARFYTELHALSDHALRHAGAVPIEPWQPPATVRAKALPLLPDDLRSWAETVIDLYEGLPDDPLGATYGYFDGHGWNMAFDVMCEELTGAYDFADSGFGPLQQEFVYAAFVSFDLAHRLIDAYEIRSGRALDRQRVAVLTAYHRLSEMAELAHDPAHHAMLLRNVIAAAKAFPSF